MNQLTFTKVSAGKAQEIRAQYSGEGEIPNLPPDDTAPATYFDALMKQQQYLEAIRFLAFALPKREAIGWACQCVRRVSGEQLDQSSALALAAAEQWVREPSEEHRRVAERAAETAGYGTPAGCAAVAVFFSGGSLAPAHVPEVPPGPTLTAQSVAGCLHLAAVQQQPDRIADKQRSFLTLGVEIANGTRHPID